MPEYKIANTNYLSEDKAVISDENITSTIDIYKIDQTTQSNNNSTSNQATSTKVPLASSTTISENGQTLTALSQGVKIETIGSNGDSGKLTVKTSISSNNLPNIYFNIRKNSFDSKSLYFRFKTSDIASSAGTTTDTWTSDSNLLSGLSLTGHAGCLTVTQAYGQKFYELASTKSIGISNFSFNVPKNPTYAFLVYALANASTTTALYKDSNQIHKFQAFSDSGILPIYNNSYTAGKYNQPEQNYGLFSLSPLLSNQFISPFQQRNGLNVINIDNYNFPYNFSSFLRSGVVTPSGVNNINPPPEFISNKIFNLCNTPNSLSSPTATNTPFIINQGGSDIPLNTFSLFFVEMYSYLELPPSNQQDASYNILNVITKINGLTHYTTKILIKPDINYSNNINCNISIGNNPGSGGVRMFLFDYLYGTSRDVSSMTQDRNLILESLGYDNRKVLLKSSSDLQMTNATSSLRFPASLSHPFLNMYFS
jgi:hypothetical protein